MKKNILLSSVFVLLFIFSQAQPNLIGTCSAGAIQFGSIFNYTVGDTALSNVYELEGNPGSNLIENGMIEISGKLYGCLAQGGAYNAGIIYEYDPLTNNYTSIYDFHPSTGSAPFGELLLASNGLCYGTTNGGGIGGGGVLFEFDIASKTYTKKFDMVISSGVIVSSSLIQATNGKLYGLAKLGGTFGKGVLFEFDYTSNIYTVKLNFNGLQGEKPQDKLLQASNGKLYGTTSNGGATDDGVIFEFDIVTSTYSKKIDLGFPIGTTYVGLIQATNGKLYGTTSNGGINFEGTIFEYDYSTNILTTKFEFPNANNPWCGFPSTRLLQASNGKFYGTTKDCASLFEYDVITNTYNHLVLFSAIGGSGSPNSGGTSVMQALNGKIYGALDGGGSARSGLIFEYDLNTHTVQKKIDLNYAPKGSYPDGSLLLASNGKFYGVTYYGGSKQYGCLFEYDYASNTSTKKFDFDLTANGLYPSGSLMEASNGKLYGTTQRGGSVGEGTLYEYDYNTNIFTKKINFNENEFDPVGTLIEASNGKFYGMATGDDSNWFTSGYLYEYDPINNWITYTYIFTNSAGVNPYGSLIEASNGKLYGMTSSGGVGYGTIFEFDCTTHTVTNIHSFQASIDGNQPYGSLLEATNGKLYGMTKYGGTYNVGTIFEFDYTSNTFTNKIDLTLTEGSYPIGALMEASNSKLYGMTYSGGLYNDGVLFEYDYVANTYIKQIDFNSPLTGAKPANSALLEVNCVAPAISPSGPTSFCEGGSVTLNAITISGGTYQWKRNGNSIAGATSQSLLVTNPGRYSVTVTDSICNTAFTSSATRVSIPCIYPFDPQEKIAIDDNNSDATSLTIFFDTNLKILNVKAHNLKGNSFNISLFDNTGKLAFTENGVVVNSDVSSRINCSTFSSGLFIAKLSTEQEQKVKKFVKN
ncbi:MAG: T9SS type A sorting domain-containing protein [Bacteroidetes bacterium]|nr:T9SS type A sorting domain-containing protein [Bacteroidota bacterium]